MSILMTCKEACPYIYQVVSREFPFAAICLEKELTRITEIVWSCSMVCEIFFAPNSPIFRKSSTEGEIGNSIASRFTCKHNKFSPLDIITWNTQFFISKSIFENLRFQS